MKTNNVNLRVIAGLLSVVCMLLCTPCVYAQTATTSNTGEEFNGPFPSWKNVKIDYGAVGDGKADDTAATMTRLGSGTIRG